MHTFIGLVCEWCGEMMMVAAMAARLSLYPLLSQVAYLKTSKSCEKLLRINTSPSQPPKQTHCAAHRNQHFNSRFFKKLIIVFESHSFGPPERLLQKLCCFSRARWIFRLFVCVFCVFFFIAIANRVGFSLSSYQKMLALKDERLLLVVFFFLKIGEGMEW